MAQTDYGIKPLRADAALKAWDHALKIARNGVEREGVYVHQARVQRDAGRFDEARRLLERVHIAKYNDLKTRLLQSIESKEKKAKPVAEAPEQKPK